MFDAGTAWLQILPSFDNVQRAFDNEVARMGRQMDSVIAASIKNGFANGLKDAKQAGQEAGKEYSSGLRQGLRDAKNDLIGFGDNASRQAGEKAGDKFGDGFSKSAGLWLPRGVREGVEAAGKVGEDAAGKAGANAGGAFADSFRRRMLAGSRSIGSIQLGADSNDEDVQLADIKRQMDQLANVTVGVDLDEGQAIVELEDLKRRLRALSDDTVSVRVKTDAMGALAELGAVKGLADQVDRTDPTIRVKTTGDREAGASMRELADTVRALTDATGVSSSRLGFLIAVGATIGSVIVPAAAAAAAAIGAIGTAAAAVGAGLGVTILGFSGIGTAVQAMDKAASEADKSTASLTKSQNAAARAADGVTSAESSLANTRANVASGARRAAQAVVDAQDAVVRSQRDVVRAQKDVEDAQRNVIRAEQDVADAKRDALRAEEALTRAYRDARREQEDQVLSIKENALAQRQAQIDLIESKKKLDRIMANNRATQEEREAARIDYEERVLRLEELGIKQRRLAEDKADADKKGIEGSDKVVAAQDRLVGAQDRVASAQDKVGDAMERVGEAQDKVRDALENVAKAQRKVGDAIDAQRDQARQGAYQISQAQQAVVNAMRSMENAAESAGVAGGAAMRNLKQAMDQLGPAGQKFVKFLYDLKPLFLDLRDTAQEGLLPGVQQAITDLLPYFPRIKQFVGDVAKGVGDLFVKFAAGFKDPVWQDFFRLVADQTVPMLQQLFTAASNVAKGVAGIIVAMSRFNGPIMDGLVRFTEDFAKWSAELGKSSGFQKFAEYVRQAGPAVVELIKQVGILLFHIIEAAAPLGLVMVKALTAVVSWINSWDIGVLKAVLVVIVGFYGSMLALTAATRIATVVIDAYRAAVLLWSLTTGIATRAANLFAGAQLVVEAASGGARAAAAAAGAAVGGFGRAMSGLKGGATAGASAVGSLVGLVGLGGPLAIALGAGALLIATWANAHQDAAKKVAAHRKSVDEINAAISKNSGLVDENVRKVAAKAAMDDGALKLGKQIGVNLSDITNAYIHGGTAVDALVNNLDKYIEKEQIATQTDSANSTQHTQNIKSARELQQVLIGQKEAHEANAGKVAESTEKQRLLDEAMRGSTRTVADKLTPAQKELGFTTDTLAKAQDALGLALRTVSDASKTAADRADALKAADDAVFGSVRNNIAAEQDNALALLEVTAAGQRNEQQGLRGKATLDLHSEAAIRNRQMLEERFLALGQQFLADVRSGTAVDVASQKHSVNREALINAAKAANFDSQEVDKLARTFGTLPTDPNVHVNVLGVAEAMNKLETAQIAEFGLRHGLDPAEARRQWNQQKDPLHRAKGGAVFGPGGPTDDKVPAWLSDGEHVLTAAEVKAAGGHAAVESFRKRLLSGQVGYMPGYALGGPVARVRSQPHLQVDWPFNFPVRVSIPPVGSTLGGASFGAWPSSPAAQRGDSGVWRSIVALIKSTGPLSGSFGNAYRPGDPLWHGSGRAVDWMGYGQDALATFLAGRRPLELIHRTGRRDYAYTRGRDMGSFNNQLMEEHTNHIHVAMDNGGWLEPGLSQIYNGTGSPEPVLTQNQWTAVSRLAAQGAAAGNTYNFNGLAGTMLTADRLRAMQDRDAALARIGRAR